jgi:pilus assembly protein CpaE
MRTAVLASDVSHPLNVTLRQLIEEKLDPEGPLITAFEQAENVLFRFRPQALLVVLSPDPHKALRAMSKVRSQVAGRVLAVGPTADPKLILRALQEGADHYLDEDDLPEQFAAVLPRLVGKEQPRTTVSGQTISVLAAGGGCGSSTLAVNLAVVLAAERQRCALVDLKPGVGDLAALLDLKPEHTLADLCLNPALVDEAMLEKAGVTHSSGVCLLAAPLHFEDIRLLTPVGVQRVLGLARASFPHVVVDHEDCFHEEQILALRHADTILLVARLDYTSLRSARRILDHLDRMDVPRERVSLVINRHGQAKELPKEEVEGALRIKLTHFIPEDPGPVNGANNTGVPVVLKAPSSKAAQAIRRLGKNLLAASPTPAPKLSSQSRSAVMRWLAPFR